MKSFLLRQISLRQFSIVFKRATVFKVALDSTLKTVSLRVRDVSRSRFLWLEPPAGYTVRRSSYHGALIKSSQAPLFLRTPGPPGKTEHDSILSCSSPLTRVRNMPCEPWNFFPKMVFPQVANPFSQKPPGESQTGKRLPQRSQWWEKASNALRDHDLPCTCHYLGYEGDNHPIMIPLGLFR